MEQALVFGEWTVIDRLTPSAGRATGPMRYAQGRRSLGIVVTDLRFDLGRSVASRAPRHAHGGDVHGCRVGDMEKALVAHEDAGKLLTRINGPAVAAARGAHEAAGKLVALISERAAPPPSRALERRRSS